MITNQQIKKLERLLEQTGLEYMPADILQGFLAAAAIGPHAISPSQWLPFIFFEEEQMPRIEGDVNLDLLIKALMDFYNSTLFEIQNNQFDPIITVIKKDGEEIEEITGWCRGFSVGLRFWGDDWEKMDENGELAAMVVPIIYMADIKGHQPEFSQELLKQMEDSRKEFEEELSTLVFFMWSFWAEKRLQTPVRGERIGRNDPCPCGSGKKFKKCCGAS